MKGFSLFTGKERRRYVRLAIHLNAEFKLNGENGDASYHKGMAIDISTEGICLVTDLFSQQEWEEIAQKKRHLYLHIGFPKFKKKLVAEAEVQSVAAEAAVVWYHRERKEGKDLYRLGLQFTMIEKEDQDMIRRYIADNLIAKYKPV